MHYNITQLSDSEAQELGEILFKNLRLYKKRIAMATQNVHYTAENSRKYGVKEWSEPHTRNVNTLERLQAEFEKVEKIYKLICD